MKKKLFSVLVAFALALGLIFGFATTAPAQQNQTSVTIDLSKLPADKVAAVMEAQKAANNPIPDIPTVEKAKEWVVFGKEIGVVLATVCKELSIGVNDFVKTPVGKITMYMIVWKVMGQDIWHIVGGLGMWVLVTSILIWSYRFFHMTVKVGSAKEGNLRYIPRYTFETKDARGASASAHAIIFVVLTAVCLIIVF